MKIHLTELNMTTFKEPNFVSKRILLVDHKYHHQLSLLFWKKGVFHALMDQITHSCFVFRKIWAQISDWKPAILTKYICGFPQSFMCLKIGHGHFFPHPLQFMTQNNPTTWYYIKYAVEEVFLYNPRMRFDKLVQGSMFVLGYISSCVTPFYHCSMQRTKGLKTAFNLSDLLLSHISTLTFIYYG